MKINSISQKGLLDVEGVSDDIREKLSKKIVEQENQITKQINDKRDSQVVQWTYVLFKSILISLQVLYIFLLYVAFINYNKQ